MRNFYSEKVVGICGGYIGSTPYYNNIFTINTSLCLPAVWRVHLKREREGGKKRERERRGGKKEREKEEGARRRGGVGERVYSKC